MKYLKKIETENDIHLVTERPNLVLINNTKRVLYNAPTGGVSIQHIDGKLYSTDEWTANGFSKNEANGIAIIDAAARFVVAKQYIDINKYWSNDDSIIEGVLIAENESDAKKDYAGKANTDIIIQSATSGAVYECANYTFPNGQKGYLPSLGEWAIVNKYKADVIAAIEVVGGNLERNTDCKWLYWSSTQGPTGDSAWYYTWSTSVFGTLGKKDIFKYTPGARVIFCAFTSLVI
jgi:hypothetical protein